MISADNYVRKILLINAIGDFVVAIMMVFLADLMAEMMGFAVLDEVKYLAGGWGVAALSFGALRLFAARHPNLEICWFTALFGLFEGTTLVLYGIIIVFVTSLTFSQVALSTLFALFFVITYGYGYLLKNKEKK
jgi:hypothetical protein